MKGLKKVSNATKRTASTNRASWVSLYYSISKDTVYTEAGNGRYFVTYIINPNTANEIQEVVESWKRL